MPANFEAYIKKIEEDLSIVALHETIRIMSAVDHATPHWPLD